MSRTLNHTFTFSRRSSVLEADINPPIELDEDGEYMLGLVNFESYNAIPNIIDGVNNNFYFAGNKYTLPTGSYDIKDIRKCLMKLVNNGTVQSNIKDKSKKEIIIFKENRSTLKCDLIASQDIDFTKDDSFGDLLGFGKRVLTKHESHTSEYPINILKVNTICVSCNLVTGSYTNGNPTHIIHEFFPDVEPGEKIIESPKNVIYMPINTRRISSIIVQIHDQDGDLINFRQEVITLRLHLKKLIYNGN